ncbi:hypothetical protein D9757_010931 [Collybiopsis confluens]|uniref:Uncharacterized protein n=1 Tax=Collybiopsis confluens TaxID=2823264 RepID=A0A8H5GJ97_9AGAR|nr:hypothetical protein D9757_010931 [Collybiopsis confluens]
MLAWMNPDPLPPLTPDLNRLYHLLYGCRFPAVWRAYHSDSLENLRDNYTVEGGFYIDIGKRIAISTVTSLFLFFSFLPVLTVSADPTELKQYADELGSEGTVVNSTTTFLITRVRLLLFKKASNCL